jgi:apolipoprotein N-acyltransferase
MDRYDKIHLVPFGEYIPLETIFPFIKRLVPFTESYSPGTRYTIFSVPFEKKQAHFGVLICYEDTDPKLARTFRRKGAEFLVNISNDAWFLDSWELEQHFTAARFRAIENRVGIVRVGNNGISGFINPTGAVDKVLSVRRNGKDVTKNILGTLVGNVRITQAKSLYTVWGNAPLLVGGLLVIIIWCIRFRCNLKTSSG